MTSSWIVFFCLLLLQCTVPIKTDCINLDKSVIIRNQISGLVLDGSNSAHLTIQSYGSSLSQQWKLQPSTTLGLFNIINLSSGKALYLGSFDQGLQAYNTTTQTLSDAVSQQWFINSSGSIATAAAANYVLDIYKSNYTAGNFVLVYPETGNPNEKFTLQHQVRAENDRQLLV